MGKKMFQVERIEYFRRHFLNFLPYLSLKKAVNLIRNAVEMRLVVVSPKSLPPYIKVEPTPLCQLRCTGCPQRDPEFRRQFNGEMQLTPEALERIIEPLKDTLLGISLSLTGEPMLNKHIIELIEYVHSKNICASFPSNFSVPLGEEKAERLARSGLDALYVSLDGASSESYTKYRVGGRFDLILKNVRLLSEAKKRFGLRRPKIIWKYVIFEHNKHEVEKAKSEYKSLGFDAIEFDVDMGSVTRSSMNEDSKKGAVEAKRACFWLWHTMIIRWNGAIDPCCNASGSPEGTFNLGKAVTDDSADIFRGKAYAGLRRGFVKADYGRKMHPLCRSCMRCSVEGEYVRGGDVCLGLPEP